MTVKYEIVCIDDEIEILDLYKNHFSDTGYNVETFSDPSEAKDYILKNKNRIIYIFSDYKMPDINGIDLRRSIYDETGDIPCSLVTAFYNKEMAVQGMELKINAFINKPFEEEDLLKLLDSEGKKRKTTLDEEREMVSAFIEESSPMLEEIEELILVLEDDPDNINALNTYFRLLHTIKGTASCVGLKTMPDFAHKYEDLVGLLKSGTQKVTKEVIDILLKGLDFLKEMYADIANGKSFEFDISDKVKIFDLSRIKESKETEEIEVKEVVRKEEIDAKSQTKSEDEKISVSVSVLDSFMELSGELTVVRNTILKSVATLEEKYRGDKDVDQLSDALSEMHKVSSILQNQISDMRKISVDTVFRPMKRVVRDASKNLGKIINFETQGEGLRLDTSIAKILSNTLVHLIRNGIDHGIEKPEVREKKGKTKEGSISLNCYEDVESILVEIEDDGNGLDPQKLKQKAVEKGLYSEEELDKMSDSRVYSLIFESGFSTATEVTDISGRGVGMDMVRSSVEAIGGKILIDSELGKGTKFVLVLPIPRSVLIIKSLMVRSHNLKLCVPLDAIVEVVNYEQIIQDQRGDERIHIVEGRKIMKRHGTLVPLIDVKEVFSKDGNVQDNQNDFSIVIVKGEGLKYGIVVDHIDDIEEVVVKKMSAHLGHIKAFSGATFIGDGEMALILDLDGLAASSSITVKEAEDEHDNYFNKSFTDENKTDFMQFDLEKHKNYGVPLHWVHRLEEIPVSSIECSGDIHLIHYRGKSLPLIFVEKVLDLECSDINSYLNKKENLDVIVIKTKGNLYGFVVDDVKDIGSSSSEIDTSTNDRSGVLGTVLIEEKTITIIDTMFLAKHYKKEKLRDEAAA